MTKIARKTMKHNIFGMFSIIAGILILCLQGTTIAQKATGTAPVTVTNTTANPVPVTGTVAATITGTVEVTNTPTVNAKQSGNWSVDILGTPTVKVAPAGGVFTGKYQYWTDSVADVRVFSKSDDEAPYSKVWVCVKNAAPQPIGVHIFTFIPYPGHDPVDLNKIYFELDSFALPTGNSCKVYDAPGYYVQAIAQANGNTSGYVSIGISQR